MDSNSFITIALLLLLFVPLSLWLIQTLLTYLNLSEAKIFIKDGYFWKITKFKKEKLEVNAIQSLESKDLTGSFKSPLSFEDYPSISVDEWTEPTRVGVELLSTSNSLLLPQTFLRFSSTVNSLKSLLEEKTSIKTDGFVRKLIEHGFYEDSLLFRSPQGREINRNHYQELIKNILISIPIVAIALVIFFVILKFFFNAPI